MTEQIVPHVPGPHNQKSVYSGNVHIIAVVDKVENDSNSSFA